MKSIKIGEFLDRLHERLKKGGDSDAFIFFEVFLQNRLIRETEEIKEISFTAREYKDIYLFAVYMLRDAASSSFSKHSDTYKAAHAVSVAFCQELNEVFKFSGSEVFDLIPIKSYMEMGVEAGVVTIKDGMVRLTPEGEKGIKK